MPEFRIIWDDAAIAADTGSWPIVLDLSTVIYNPVTGLMEMTVPEGERL